MNDHSHYRLIPLPRATATLPLFVAAVCLALWSCKDAPPPEPTSPQTVAAPQPTAPAVSPPDVGSPTDANAADARRDAGEPQPLARPGVPVIRGPLDKPMVAEVLSAAVPALSTCYEEELRRLPSAEGRMVVRIEVDATGSVTKVTEAETQFEKEGAFSNCVTTHAKIWKFPVRDDASTVFQPITFSPPAVETDGGR